MPRGSGTELRPSRCPASGGPLTWSSARRKWPSSSTVATGTAVRSITFHQGLTPATGPTRWLATWRATGTPTSAWRRQAGRCSGSGNTNHQRFALPGSRLRSKSDALHRAGGKNATDQLFLRSRSRAALSTSMIDFPTAFATGGGKALPTCLYCAVFPPAKSHSGGKP